MVVYVAQAHMAQISSQAQAHISQIKLKWPKVEWPKSSPMGPRQRYTAEHIHLIGIMEDLKVFFGCGCLE